MRRPLSCRHARKYIILSDLCGAGGFFLPASGRFLTTQIVIHFEVIVLAALLCGSFGINRYFVRFLVLVLV